MIRVMFCGGTLPPFFEAPLEERKEVFEMCKQVFGGWKERYGIEVLATLDDDQIQIGPTTGHPWTFYILCDVPEYEAVPKVVDQLRHGDPPLFKYIKLEARMGRPLEVIGLNK